MTFLRFLHSALLAMAFALCAATAAQATPSASEHKVIDALIQRISTHTTMTFMRNGNEYPAAEAAQHMRAKYDHFKREIVTAEDFIRLCGTRSEVTKKRYKVRMADKTMRDSSEFLTAELRVVRQRIGKSSSPAPAK